MGKPRSGKTPKYGLIFGSSWISRAKDKDRGRMSRVLSNQLAKAARIDCFSRPGESTNVYGQKLREQLETRLDYWATGKVPRTNTEVMDEAFELVQVENENVDTTEPVVEKQPEEEKTVETPKKKKKKKKKKKSATPVVEATPAPEQT